MENRKQKAAHRLDPSARDSVRSTAKDAAVPKKKSTLARSQPRTLPAARNRIFHILINAFPDFVLIADREGRILSCNTQVRQKYLQKGGCRHDTVFDVFPTITTHYWQETFSGGRKAHPAPHFEGESEGRFFSHHLFPFTGTKGKISFIVVFVREISEIRQTENALLASERKYRELAENISDALFTLNEQGDVIDVNRAIESFLGYSQEEVKGKPFAEFLYPAESDLVAGDWEGIFSGRSPRREFRFLHKNGVVRWGRVSSRPVVFKDEVIGYQGVISDITRWKTLDVNLLAILQENILSSLAAAFTTEIGVTLKRARERLFSHSAPAGPDSEIDASLRALMHDLEGISLYLKHFAAFAGRREDAARLLDVNALAESALALLAWQLAGAGVEVRSSLARDLEPVSADSFSLVQSFVNVFSYSLSACREAGDSASPKMISLTTSMEKDRVIVDVRGTGREIPDELVTLLDDPVDAHRFARGAGVGLAIARRLVESQGGSFQVMPGEPPVGAHIRIAFPSVIQTI